jgi:hypothetical protein
MSRFALTSENIHETFRLLGLDSAEAREHFDVMRGLSESGSAPPRYTVTTSDRTGCEVEHAELERDSERDEGVWKPS